MMRNSIDGPNIASPSAAHGNANMRIKESERAVSAQDEIRFEEHNFDDMKYKIGKSTKEMVGKILKAAGNGNDSKLNSLLD